MHVRYYAELLREHPALLRGIVAFNREGAPEAPLGAWASALADRPDLRARLNRAPLRECWDFAEPAKRVALLSAPALERLGKLGAAALMADVFAKTIRRDDVAALRESLGEALLNYALLRGRWQTGNVHEAIAPLMRYVLRSGLPEETSTGERTLVLARLILEALREGWPEALRAASEARFAALNLPARPDDVPELTPEARARLWAFLNKLILRELEQPWPQYFA